MRKKIGGVGLESHNDFFSPTCFSLPSVETKLLSTFGTKIVSDDKNPKLLLVKVEAKERVSIV